MIRYTTLNDGSDSRRAFQRKLHQSFPRFIAYCGIRRACRVVPQIKLERPVVVGIVVPDGADMDVYEDGASYAAHGPSVLYGGEAEAGACPH